MNDDTLHLDGMFEWFENIRDTILDVLSAEEAREYHFDCKQSKLFAVRIRVNGLLPSILRWLDNAFQTDSDALPPLPRFESLREKGDFLLGCYWVLAQARLNTLDYHRCFSEADSARLEACHERAAIRFAAGFLTGAQRHFLWWPWGEQGNPFYE